MARRGGFAANAASQEVVPIEMADPVFEENPVRAYPVVQYLDGHGDPIGYSLLIKTEVCIDRKCQVVEVTMYWDALGYYKQFKCPPDKPLTKKEHTPFAKADYIKLDSILRDRQSLLGTHSLAFMAKPSPAENETDILVDALSGATPTTVQQTVVKDAAYTSWAMWQWANGEVVSKLRQLTEKHCTPSYLKALLHSDDRRHVDFALKYVATHHVADKQFLDSVFYVLKHGDREHVALALDFVANTITDRAERHSRLIDAFYDMSSLYNPMVLDKLAAERDLPASTLEQLTAHLDRLPYFQVHLVLRLLERRKFFSSKVESDLCRLLEHENFFIARRANEFLMKQKLSSGATEKLKAFREFNQSRL